MATLFILPLLVAIACVGGAIAIWRSRETQQGAENAPQSTHVGALEFMSGCLLFIAFGIGACYAYVFIFMRLH